MKTATTAETRNQTIARFFENTAQANEATAAKMTTPEFKNALLTNAKSARNAAASYRALDKEATVKEENDALNEWWAASEDPEKFWD